MMTVINSLILYMPCNSSTLLLSSADIFFPKINLFQKFFQEHYRVSNGLDPDQTRFVGPDLDPKGLQISPEDTKSHR